MNLHRENELFEEVVRETASYKMIPEDYVVKDYFVSLLLKNILEEAPNIVFKGGTSLSKCYGVIHRFSEDIDINLKLDEKATNSDKRGLKEAVIRAIEKSEMELTNSDEIRSRRDHNNYRVKYKTESEENEVLRPHLLVETYLTLKSFPFEMKKVNNYIFEYLTSEEHIDLIKQYDLSPFEISVQSIKRTFIDKMFAICDYHEKTLYAQNSRHFYDLHRIWESLEFLPDEFVTLFYEVAKERRKSNVNVSCSSGYQIKQVLRDILDKDLFRDDYETITDNLLFVPARYETVKESILHIINGDILPDIVE